MPIKGRFTVLAGLALVAAAAGCLDPSLAGPARRLEFRTRDGRVAARLPPLPARLTVDEEAAYGALRDGRETPDLVLRAALLVGGVTEPAELARHEAAARQAFEALRARVEREADPAARARVLLAEMHARLLRAYALDQTYPHVVLDTGVYNCVSASLLYNVFAGWLGFATGGSLLPSHARSFVDLGEGAARRRVQVETTSADGFDPRLSPAEERAFLQLRALHGEFRAQPFSVGNSGLLALVIDNRMGFEHDRADGGARAALAVARVLVALGARLAALAPDDRTGWRNQVVRLDRLALRVVADGHFDEGAELQRLVVELAGDQGEEAERVRTNVAWAAERRLAAAFAARRLEAVLPALDGARALIGCGRDRRAELCGKLDQFTRALYWNHLIPLVSRGACGEVAAVRARISEARLDDPRLAALADRCAGPSPRSP